MSERREGGYEKGYDHTGRLVTAPRARKGSERPQEEAEDYLNNQAGRNKVAVALRETEDTELERRLAATEALAKEAQAKEDSEREYYAAPGNFTDVDGTVYAPAGGGDPFARPLGKPSYAGDSTPLTPQAKAASLEGYDAEDAKALEALGYNINGGQKTAAAHDPREVFHPEWAGTVGVGAAKKIQESPTASKVARGVGNKLVEYARWVSSKPGEKHVPDPVRSAGRKFADGTRTILYGKEAAKGFRDAENEDRRVREAAQKVRDLGEVDEPAPTDHSFVQRVREAMKKASK